MSKVQIIFICYIFCVTKYFYKIAGGRNTESGKQLATTRWQQFSRLKITCGFKSLEKLQQFSRLCKENLQTLSCWWQITFVFQSLEKLSFQTQQRKPPDVVLLVADYIWASCDRTNYQAALHKMD